MMHIDGVVLDGPASPASPAPVSATVTGAGFGLKSPEKGMCGRSFCAMARFNRIRLYQLHLAVPELGMSGFALVGFVGSIILMEGIYDGVVSPEC